MNTDTEDTWLAVGAGISVGIFGLCICGAIVRKMLCPRRPLKESRSDTDLANMLEQGEST